MAVEIPNYRIIEKLGVGAQTRVFRARDMRSGQDYTVKIVKIVKPEDASFIELLKTEYAIGSAIDHPVIRKVFELRFLRQRLRVRGAILFMEYVNGLPLSEKSEKDSRRSLDDMLRIFAESARGLHAMHVAGWVHADLKPNNILVTPPFAPPLVKGGIGGVLSPAIAKGGMGEVKIIDLGQSARIHEAKVRVQGTMDYMAPEQVQRGTLDQRTDVFGLGATLHKVLTGKSIPTGMNQTMSLHSQNLVGRRIDEIRESTMHDLPPCVSRLIDDCCQSEPAARIQAMPGLVERIDLARTILASQPSAADDQVLLPDELDLESGENDRTDSFDPVAEGLGLNGEEGDDLNEFRID